MFTTGVNSAHDGGGSNGGSLLVPARFVWPHGGRRVSLIGSFTRWQEHLQMTPVEGCPTVFQAICRLTPGLHQYKFIVDGEWRHDEHQPFVAGSYGIVNTMDLSRGSTPVSAISNSEPSSSIGMNMEVDPVNFQRVVHVSLPHDVLQASRHCVLEFLSNHTAYDLIPDSGKVVMLDVNLPVKQAFHILYEQGLSVAPLWDSYKGQFVGILSALDFILILRELGSHGSNLTEEELETHSIYAWKEGKRHMVMNGLVDSQGRPYPRHLIHASPYDSLQEVALKILNHAVATVPILHSSNEDGSFPQLLHLASLCGILRCICRHFRHSSSSLPILYQPISELGLGSWIRPGGNSTPKPILMLRPNDSLSSALNLLVDARVSCLPIVDDNNSLLDIYLRSDITALAKDRAYAKIHLAETSIQQALQLGHCDASSQFGFYNGQRCQMCLPSDPLLKVMERLSIPGVRRVIVIEAGSKRVEGIISLSDVLNFLIPSEQ